MKKVILPVAVAFFVFLINFSSANACTDFRLIATDGTVIIARSMEFAQDLNSNLISSPRDKTFSNVAPNGKPALNWKTQYGYVFLDGLGSGVALDGMNEVGLAAEALYLPDNTQYQTVPDGKEKQALPYLHFVDWLLGNFKTVAEVKQALNSVYVYAQEVPQAKGMTFPLHFNITDNSGKSIVVEFVAKQMHVYDNDVGILTNSPTYDWHIANLHNYVHLSPTTAKPIVVDGMTFVSTGQGSGMLGLPGDVSPPSRFVRIAALLNTVFKPADATTALNLAQHIINNVDIPLGFVREGDDPNKATNELTQWVVFKDLTNKIFYYRTYHDLSLRAVSVAKVNFSFNAPQHKMPITSKQSVEDMTTQFVTGMQV
jgi:choloylglycine hydrolase